jgi:hypothetical protein
MGTVTGIHYHLDSLTPPGQPVSDPINDANEARDAFLRRVGEAALMGFHVVDCSEAWYKRAVMTAHLSFGGTRQPVPISLRSCGREHSTN